MNEVTKVAEVFQHLIGAVGGAGKYGNGRQDERGPDGVENFADEAERFEVVERCIGVSDELE